jgi:hypothetical protein
MSRQAKPAIYSASVTSSTGAPSLSTRAHSDSHRCIHPGLAQQAGAFATTEVLEHCVVLRWDEITPLLVA